MNKEENDNYIFLDGAVERKELILNITGLRRQMRELVASVPESDWYLPRYGEWSLAGLLGHLNLCDNLSLMTVRMALAGLRPATSTRMLNRVNRITARVFRTRLMDTSLDGMAKNEHRIIDFIMGLSMDKFTRRVWHPREQRFFTVEKAIQDFWWLHWVRHIEQIKIAEGITPPSQTDGT